MVDPQPPLGGLATDEFLKRYWQREPLLIREAIPDLKLEFGAKELRQLAGIEQVRSRLVRMPNASTDWSSQSGPFDESMLADLPDLGWSLLVHGVDQHLPQVARLLDRFRFVPNWRIDDVMVSLAPDGAGVGPHLDRYDVFLLQGSGRRRWRIGGRPAAGEQPKVRGDGMSVLVDPDFDREYMLEPGDMLYLPPQIPHDGVALGHSVTLSVGFRAPDPREFCRDFLTSLPPEVFETIRYVDPAPQPIEHHGELSAAAREQLRNAAASLFLNHGNFDPWLGRFVTRPLRSAPRPSPTAVRMASQWPALVQQGAFLKRSAPPHFAWYATERDLQLFVGGEAYRLEPRDAPLAELLCGCCTLDASALAPHVSHATFCAIVVDLILRGYLELVSPVSS